MITQSVSEKILQMAINKLVSEKLGRVTCEIGELNNKMSNAEKKTAGLMVLGMMQVAADEFFSKMEARISNRDKYSV